MQSSARPLLPNGSGGKTLRRQHHNLKPPITSASASATMRSTSLPLSGDIPSSNPGTPTRRSGNSNSRDNTRSNNPKAQSSPLATAGHLIRGASPGVGMCIERSALSRTPSIHGEDLGSNGAAHPWPNPSPLRTRNRNAQSDVSIRAGLHSIANSSGVESSPTVALPSPRSLFITTEQNLTPKLYGRSSDFCQNAPSDGPATVMGTTQRLPAGTDHFPEAIRTPQSIDAAEVGKARCQSDGKFVRSSNGSTFSSLSKRRNLSFSTCSEKNRGDSTHNANSNLVGIPRGSRMKQMVITRRSPSNSLFDFIHTSSSSNYPNQQQTVNGRHSPTTVAHDANGTTASTITATKKHFCDSTRLMLLVCATIWIIMTVSIHKHAHFFLSTTSSVDVGIATAKFRQRPAGGNNGDNRGGIPSSTYDPRKLKDGHRDGRGQSKVESTHTQLYGSFYPRIHIFEHGSEDNDKRTSTHAATKKLKKFSILSHQISIPLIQASNRREVKHYPSEYSDPTQKYHLLDSTDKHDAKKLKTMERREEVALIGKKQRSLDGKEVSSCVYTKTWQTTFHPTCNYFHEIDLKASSVGGGGTGGGHGNATLFGTKGYWRDAWRWETNSTDEEQAVLKTLKYKHNFEEDFYEHNRVDAVAMERLTSSPHVIDIYSFCGQSVLTEYAGGPRFGEVADKAKGLEKLRLASNVAQAIADVHSIDSSRARGRNKSKHAKAVSLTHFDVNLANFVAVNKTTVKLNDFNIGILMKWNETSDSPCGFPAKYPSPQWRSPEEARNSTNLSEKVDVYSLGNIFFRLICNHEPWNKLEPDGKPTKEQITEKIKRGKLPHVPKKVRESKDYATAVIRDAMMKCFTLDPRKRPTAQSIVDTLRTAIRVGKFREE